MRHLVVAVGIAVALASSAAPAQRIGESRGAPAPRIGETGGGYQPMFDPAPRLGDAVPSSSGPELRTSPLLEKSGPPVGPLPDCSISSVTDLRRFDCDSPHDRRIPGVPRSPPPPNR
jgi:hypothetical protein